LIVINIGRGKVIVTCNKRESARTPVPGVSRFPYLFWLLFGLNLDEIAWERWRKGNNRKQVRM